MAHAASGDVMGYGGFSTAFTSAPTSDGLARFLFVLVPFSGAVGDHHWCHEQQCEGCDENIRGLSRLEIPEPTQSSGIQPVVKRRASQHIQTEV